MEINIIEFVPLAVLLPLFGAAFAFAFYRNQSTQKAIAIGTLVSPPCWRLRCSPKSGPLGPMR